ncbi:unnamed protein product [Bemisia tabaci]|uniref:Uncharacterized protein n=1 Tax=Bemisia tabaci TaxID=7038 RepID=A0A9P0A2G0_BEMTA|nr:unnamed protein product [Bemisia tabaci]
MQRMKKCQAKAVSFVITECAPWPNKGFPGEWPRMPPRGQHVDKHAKCVRRCRCAYDDASEEEATLVRCIDKCHETWYWENRKYWEINRDRWRRRRSLPNKINKFFSAASAAFKFPPSG